MSDRFTMVDGKRLGVRAAEALALFRSSTSYDDIQVAMGCTRQAVHQFRSHLKHKHFSMPPMVK